MSRKHPMAAIYKLTNLKNNKIYIGETSNYVDRMSQYKSTEQRGKKYASNPVYRAILEYGWDNFTHEILLSDKEEPKLKDTTYRRKMESAFIISNRATDPNIGYNSIEEFSASVHKNHARKGVPCAAATRILKSDPIFVYDMKHDYTLLYFGKKDFADEIGKDKAIIARCAKNGKATSHYLVFHVDGEKRYEVADAVLDRRVNGVDFNGRAKGSLKNYLVGLKAVEEFASEWGFETIDLDGLLDRYHLK